MTLMTVKDGGDEDFCNKPRWSANNKMDSVMRLLRGETIDELSRETGIEGHAWQSGVTASSPAKTRR
jgi:hypothetical protein